MKPKNKSDKPTTSHARNHKSPSKHKSKRGKSTKQGRKALGPKTPASKETNVVETAEYTIDVFDFDKNWHLVTPHLSDPTVQEILNDCMNVYLRGREEMWLKILGDPKRCNLDIKYDPELGPAHYDSTDSNALETIAIVDKAMDEAIARGEFAWDHDQEHTEEEWDRYFTYAERFEPPIKGTYRFYRIHGACHYTVFWQKALGERIYPQYTWKIMTGPAHSIAYGADEIGNIKVIFDLYNFNKMSPIELIAFASQKKPGPPTRPQRH
ncbi:unnamed protein product [Sphagnum balticum]